MKYNTILFDIDNTLLDFTLCEYTAVSEIMKNNSIPATDENIKRYSAINDQFWKRFERGEIEKSEIYVGRFEMLLDDLGINADAQKISTEYANELSNQHFVLDGAMELLEKLSKNYSIYYTTNGRAQTQHKRIKSSGLDKFAKGVFVSEEVGFKKPEREYFQFVLDCIQEKDRSKLVVRGDSQSSDILGGIKAGLDTVWYNPKGEQPRYCATYTVKNLNEIPDIL